MLKTYLALGDSYTIGEGVTYDERWPVQLFNELKKSTDKIDSIKFIAKNRDNFITAFSCN